MLLMLILPLQTFASAGMLGCASVHAAALERVAAVDDVMAACHEQKQQQAPAAQHNCKHCAVCALASVLPVTAISPLTLILDADRFTLQLAASFNGFIPDGPERPPRPSLA
jgi:hypothetical protein